MAFTNTSKGASVVFHLFVFFIAGALFGISYEIFHTIAGLETTDIHHQIILYLSTMILLGAMCKWLRSRYK